MPLINLFQEQQTIHTPLPVGTASVSIGKEPRLDLTPDEALRRAHFGALLLTYLHQIASEQPTHECADYARDIIASLAVTDFTIPMKSDERGLGLLRAQRAYSASWFLHGNDALQQSPFDALTRIKNVFILGTAPSFRDEYPDIVGDLTSFAQITSVTDPAAWADTPVSSWQFVANATLDELQKISMRIGISEDAVKPLAKLADPYVVSIVAAITAINFGSKFTSEALADARTFGEFSHYVQSYIILITQLQKFSDCAAEIGTQSKAYRILEKLYAATQAAARHVVDELRLIPVAEKSGQLPWLYVIRDAADFLEYLLAPSESAINLAAYFALIKATSTEGDVSDER